MSIRANEYRYMIVGAGIAGLTAARSIREHDESGSIRIISDEDRIPYKRTKISKNIAAGFQRDAFAMEPQQWYGDYRVELDYDEAVSEIDPTSKHVRLESGQTVGWEKLILATGASPIVPPDLRPKLGTDVHVVRTAAEVEGLERAVEPLRHVLVVGNGVLGVEVAEQLRKLDKEVTLVGSSARVLSQHLDDELSRRLEALLSENGVKLISGERVTSLSRKASAGAGRLSIETSAGGLAADLIVFCGGIKPRVELARNAGVSVGTGILVDEHLVTSHPDIYAAGDVAEHREGYVSFLWHAAELQGEIAGANAAGASLRHECPPFRLKCEVFGDYYFTMNRPSTEDGYVVRSEHSGPRYRRLYYREGALKGVVMVNDKEQAKAYVRAVREGWDEKKVSAELRFNS